MAVTKTCTRCGKDTTEKFEYCGFCGALLEYIDPQRREPFAGFKHIEILLMTLVYLFKVFL